MTYKKILDCIGIWAKISIFCDLILLLFGHYDFMIRLCLGIIGIFSIILLAGYWDFCKQFNKRKKHD